MPRKRREKPLTLPPKQHFRASTSTLVDTDLSDAAYRLHTLIVALSWKTGYVDCYNSELGDHLDWNREKVRRVLGQVMDLVDATTLADGRQRFTPVDSGDLPSGLHNTRLLDPVDATDQNSEGEKPSSRTPRKNDSAQQVSQICDDTCHKNLTIRPHEEEDFKHTHLNKESSSSGDVSSQKSDDTPVLSQKSDNTAVFELWQRYFDLDQRASDVIRSYLADDQVRQVAVKAGLSPPEWLADAIKLTADYDPQRPLRYFQRVVDDALAKSAEQIRLETLPPPALLELDPPNALTALWNDVTAALRRQMTKATFDAWLVDTRLVAIDNGLYTIEVAPNAVDWLEKRLKDTILRALEVELGAPAKIIFTSKGESNAT